MLAAGRSDLAVGLLIKLVAKADEWEGLGILRPGILVEAISPSGQRIERLLVCDVIAQSAAVSTAIEGVAE